MPMSSFWKTSIVRFWQSFDICILCNILVLVITFSFSHAANISPDSSFCQVSGFLSGHVSWIIFPISVNCLITGIVNNPKNGKKSVNKTPSHIHTFTTNYECRVIILISAYIIVRSLFLDKQQNRVLTYFDMTYTSW